MLYAFLEYEYKSTIGKREHLMKEELNKKE